MPELSLDLSPKTRGSHGAGLVGSPQVLLAALRARFFSPEAKGTTEDPWGKGLLFHTAPGPPVFLKRDP